MAKKKGDWWRIPVGLVLSLVNIPIYIAEAVRMKIKERWSN